MTSFNAYPSSAPARYKRRHIIKRRKYYAVLALVADLCLAIYFEPLKLEESQVRTSRGHLGDRSHTCNLALSGWWVICCRLQRRGYLQYTQPVAVVATVNGIFRAAFPMVDNRWRAVRRRCASDTREVDRQVT